MTKNEAGRVLAAVAAAYRVELADDNAEVWYGSALKNIGLELGLQVAERVIASDQWFPTPARFNEVRRAIESGTQPAQRALAAGPRSARERENAAKFISMSRELLAKWKGVRR